MENQRLLSIALSLAGYIARAQAQAAPLSRTSLPAVPSVPAVAVPSAPVVPVPANIGTSIGIGANLQISSSPQINGNLGTLVTTIPLPGLPTPITPPLISQPAIPQPPAVSVPIVAPSISRPAVPAVSVPAAPGVPAVSVPAAPGVPAVSIPVAPGVPAVSLPVPAVSVPAAPGVPALSLPAAPGLPPVSAPGVPAVSLPAAPGVPSIAPPGLPSLAIPILPSIAVPGLPSAAVPGLPSAAVPGVPSAAVPGLPGLPVLPGAPSAGVPSAAAPGAPSAAAGGAPTTQTYVTQVTQGSGLPSGPIPSLTPQALNSQAVCQLFDWLFSVGQQYMSSIINTAVTSFTQGIQSELAGAAAGGAPAAPAVPAAPAAGVPAVAPVGAVAGAAGSAVGPGVPVPVVGASPPVRRWDFFGKRQLPNLGLPSIAVPSVALPSVAVPSVAVPSVGLPPVAVPSVGLPSVAVPSVAVPSVGVPSVAVPSVAIPSVAVPSAAAGVLSGTAFQGIMAQLTTAIGSLPAPLNALLSPVTQLSLQTVEGALPVFGNVLNSDNAVGTALTALMLSQIASDPASLQSLLQNLETPVPIKRDIKIKGRAVKRQFALPGFTLSSATNNIPVVSDGSLAALPQYKQMLQQIIGGQGGLSSFTSALLGGSILYSASGSQIASVRQSLDSAIPNMLLSTPLLGQLPAITAIVGILPVLNTKFRNLGNLTDINNVGTQVKSLTRQDYNLVNSLGALPATGGLMVQLLTFLSGLNSLQARAQSLSPAAAYYLVKTLNLGVTVPTFT